MEFSFSFHEYQAKAVDDQGIGTSIFEIVQSDMNNAVREDEYRFGADHKS